MVRDIKGWNGKGACLDKRERVCRRVKAWWWWIELTSMGSSAFRDVDTIGDVL
jgi:hypothetical protein